MARPVEVANRKFISKRAVAERYDVTPRTVDRWTQAKILPAPDLTINHRRYWREAGLDQYDRRCAVERAAKDQPRPTPNNESKPAA
jgi:hypothetical protein